MRHRGAVEESVDKRSRGRILSRMSGGMRVWKEAGKGDVKTAREHTMASGSVYSAKRILRKRNSRCGVRSMAERRRKRKQLHVAIDAMKRNEKSNASCNAGHMPLCSSQEPYEAKRKGRYARGIATLSREVRGVENRGGVWHPGQRGKSGEVGCIGAP